MVSILKTLFYLSQCVLSQGDKDNKSGHKQYDLLTATRVNANEDLKEFGFISLKFSHHDLQLKEDDVEMVVARGFDDLPNRTPFARYLMPYDDTSFLTPYASESELEPLSVNLKDNFFNKQPFSFQLMYRSRHGFDTGISGIFQIHFDIILKSRTDASNVISFKSDMFFVSACQESYKVNTKLISRIDGQDILFSISNSLDLSRPGRLKKYGIPLGNGDVIPRNNDSHSLSSPSPSKNNFIVPQLSSNGFGGVDFDRDLDFELQPDLVDCVENIESSCDLIDWLDSEHDSPQTISGHSEDFLMHFNGNNESSRTSSDTDSLEASTSTGSPAKRRKLDKPSDPITLICFLGVDTSQYIPVSSMAPISKARRYVFRDEEVIKQIIYGDYVPVFIRCLDKTLNRYQYIYGDQFKVKKQFDKVNVRIDHHPSGSSAILTHIDFGDVDKNVVCSLIQDIFILSYIPADYRLQKDYGASLKRPIDITSAYCLDQPAVIPLTGQVIGIRKHSIKVRIRLLSYGSVIRMKIGGRFGFTQPTQLTEWSKSNVLTALYSNSEISGPMISLYVNIDLKRLYNTLEVRHLINLSDPKAPLINLEQPRDYDLNHHNYLEIKLREALKPGSYAIVASAAGYHGFTGSTTTYVSGHFEIC